MFECLQNYTHILWLRKSNNIYRYLKKFPPFQNRYLLLTLPTTKSTLFYYLRGICIICLTAVFGISDNRLPNIYNVYASDAATHGGHQESQPLTQRIPIKPHSHNTLVHSELQNSPFRHLKQPISHDDMGRNATRNGPFRKHTRAAGFHTTE